MKKVLIIQKAIKHYRLSFYEELYALLLKRDILLVVAYSELNVESIKSKKDNSVLPDSYGVKVPARSLFDGRIVYQSALSLINESDLVIVEQANKNVVNYLLIVLQLLGLARFAYWGHGRNLQADNSSYRERFKNSLLKLPHWWFAYTPSTKKYLIDAGYSVDKITNVNNSIDTSSLSNSVLSITEKEIQYFISSLGISDNSRVGLFCGSLYEKKLLPFLYDSVIEIRKKLPDFTLIIIGGGPDRDYIEELCLDNTWIKYLGASFSIDKAKAFRCADVVLNPGLVGLGVLDALASGVPMVTTEYPYHSPEVSYLVSGYNGLITPFDKYEYSEAIVSLLNDTDRLNCMAKNALLSSESYTTDIMASNFADGISAALL